MALREEWPRTVSRTAQAITGIRRFMCDWSERKGVTPRIGDIHPDEEDLFVNRIDEEQTGRPDNNEVVTPEKCKLVAHYSTRTPYRPIITSDIGYESLEATAFRVWSIAGTVSTMRTSIPYPFMDHSYETVTFVDPRPIIYQVLQHVNASPWEGFDRGCVLYTGARVRSEYTNLGEAAWRTEHRFWVRPLDWNYQWREARQARDGAGNLRWNTSTGDPIVVGGEAGTSGWDMLIPVLYDYENFSLLYMVR